MKIVSCCLLVVFVLTSCSKVEFVLKNNENSNPFFNKVTYKISGNNNEYVSQALIENFGLTKKEGEKIFLLSVNVSEEVIKTSIDTNQVSSSVQYNIGLSYDLTKSKGNCDKINKTYKSKFTHYPKSEGYNFGSDHALQETYQDSINQNILNFKNFLLSSKGAAVCVNEG